MSTETWPSSALRSRQKPLRVDDQRPGLGVAQPLLRDVEEPRRAVGVTCLDACLHRMRRGIDFVIQAELAKAVPLRVGGKVSLPRVGEKDRREQRYMAFVRIARDEHLCADKE